MRVAVLGGGLQGCCVALALARRGVQVVLIDKNQELLSRAAVANEGKIHLGYMYAGDLSLSTAKMMIAGAMSFAPFFERQLGWPKHSFQTSAPANYIVHRDSQRTPDQILAYLQAVHALVQETSAERPSDYFGLDLSMSLRRWSDSEREMAFDPLSALLVVLTPEVAINPSVLAKALRECIAANPRIEVRCNRLVAGASDQGHGICIDTNGSDGSSRELFDHAVNALWDGRLKLNESFGYPCLRPWLHRLKYGVSFRLPSGVAPPPSATVILGPFGEVVTYGDGLVYLTWYTECLQGISKELEPPAWDTYPAEPLRSRILGGTFEALAKLVHSLRGLDVQNLSESTVKGGVIVAWGKTDIDDPASELHQRFQIGVTTQGRFHSIDPGKLTMIPYFADICARRIVPEG